MHTDNGRFEEQVTRVLGGIENLAMSFYFAGKKKKRFTSYVVYAYDL